ncbi:MAG: NUDIX domain-containing protein [Gammaproteobacteria bacterium]|nr:NUDIX domain-containing protein [Gammaproteobacteria bacterium]
MSTPAPTRDAATILLIRDTSDGIEVFMQVRHHKIDFAAGALVFPGGAVDAADLDSGVRERTDGIEGLSEREAGFRIAAVREVFEECGVLLAREQGQADLVDATRAQDLYNRHAAAIQSEDLNLGQLLADESLRLACDELVPFAHWITPESQPKRFDTRFYVARAPEGHHATHDGMESVESIWVTPAQICKEADEGKWHVMFPTRMNIERLGQRDQVEAALALAAQTPVVPILPKAVKTDAGRKLKIPIEAGYGVSEVLVDKRGSIHPIKN